MQVGHGRHTKSSTELLSRDEVLSARSAAEIQFSSGLAFSCSRRHRFNPSSSLCSQSLARVWHSLNTNT